MPPIFNARADYTAARDVRDHTELVELLASPPQKGVLYPLIAARRAGKTWELRALEHALKGRSGSTTRYVDLKKRKTDLSDVQPADCLLLDEPELTGQGKRVRSADDFLRWCTEQHQRGTTLLLAMSPAEWVLLYQAGHEQELVSEKDLRFLSPLDGAQAQRLAARGEQATRLLPRLPDTWKRNPFLLELVFQVAEEKGSDAEEDLWELLRLVRERSDDGEFRYFDAVYQNGLTGEQRATVKKVACSTSTDKQSLMLIERCGLVGRREKRPVLVDPILEANLCPLRIHHISDLHFGPKTAERLDVKEKGEHGKRLASGLGPRDVRTDYLGHIAGLKREGRAPHVLVISGDIAEWADDAQYAEARQWLDEAVKHLAEHPRLRPDEPHLLLVGGNHDVDWQQTEGSAGAGERKRHMPFARAFADVPRSLRVQLEEPPARRKLAVARYPELGVEILLLGSSEFGGEQEKDPVRDELLELVERLRSQALGKPEAERAAALRQQVSRIDPGLVHGDDLERVRREDWTQPVRVAVLHHPVSPLPATELGRYVGLVNAGEVKDRLLQSGFCLVLHGHAHTGWFGKEEWPGRHDNRVLWIASAPSLGSKEVQEHNGFNELQIARAPQEGEPTYFVTVRRYAREGGSWVEKAQMECKPVAR
jgi:hypothetical protein